MKSNNEKLPTHLHWCSSGQATWYQIALKIKEISEYAKRKEEIFIDLKEEKVIFGNNELKFKVDSFKKKCLLEGLDDIALSLKKSDKIEIFEKDLKVKKPWVFND